MLCGIVWSLWAALTLLAGHFPGSTWAIVHYMAYFNLPARLPEFALGMWLAAAWNRGVPLLHGRPGTAAPGRLRLVLTPLLVTAALWVGLQDALLQQFWGPFGHIYLVIWCVFGALAVLRWSVAARLGNTRLILELAGASYGIYLLHQPLLGYANVLLAGVLSPGLRWVVLGLGIWVVCYRAAVWLNMLLLRLFT